MENHGFIHQQYSGYISKSYMQKSKAQEIVMELALKYSWLNKCLKECVMSTIGKEYNLKDYVNKLYENIDELDDDEIYFVEQEVEEEKDEMEL